MDVRVACVADLDIPPTEAESYLKESVSGKARTTQANITADQIDELRHTKESRPGGTPVRTFVSPQWTLEHDIAAAGFAREVHVAVQLAVASRQRTEGLDAQTSWEVVIRAIRTYRNWKKDGKNANEIAAMVYQPLYEKQASKPEVAQYLACLLHRNLPSAGRATALMGGWIRRRRKRYPTRPAPPDCTEAQSTSEPRGDRKPTAESPAKATLEPHLKPRAKSQPEVEHES